MDTDSFIVYIKANDIFKGIAKDVKTRFYTSNYELDKPLPQSNQLMKDRLSGKIMKEFKAKRCIINKKIQLFN